MNYNSVNLKIEIIIIGASKEGLQLLLTFSDAWKNN